MCGEDFSDSVLCMSVIFSPKWTNTCGNHGYSLLWKIYLDVLNDDVTILNKPHDNCAI